MISRVLAGDRISARERLALGLRAVGRAERGRYRAGGRSSTIRLHEALGEDGRDALASEILAQIFEKMQGNFAKFGEGKGNIGLGAESKRIADALMPTYRAAIETAKSKGEKGEKKLYRPAVCAGDRLAFAWG